MRSLAVAHVACHATSVAECGASSVIRNHSKKTKENLYCRDIDANGSFPFSSRDRGEIGRVVHSWMCITKEAKWKFSRNVVIVLRDQLRSISLIYLYTLLLFAPFRYIYLRHGRAKRENEGVARVISFPHGPRSWNPARLAASRVQSRVHVSFPSLPPLSRESSAASFEGERERERVWVSLFPSDNISVYNDKKQTREITRGITEPNNMSLVSGETEYISTE